MTGDRKKWRTVTPMLSKEVLEDKEEENITSDIFMDSSVLKVGGYAKDLGP
jgi:hypothetical protein